LVYPMVDFVALWRAALTTPFSRPFVYICQLFVYICQMFVYMFSCLFTFGPLSFDDGYDSRWKSNGVCFKGTVGN